VPHRYVTLGTDGYGRSDTRENLRRFFEIDRAHIVVTALKALADQESVPPSAVVDAMKRYSIDSSRPNPWES
jgi:pyruvate dehydrogenase E1 component